MREEHVTPVLHCAGATFREADSARECARRFAEHVHEGAMMHIDAIDHFVLTVASIEETCAFYERVLGMTTVSFGDGRKAVGFGSQKINLHLAGREFVPHAQHPVPGSADFCLITSLPLDDCIAHVRAQGVQVLLGPVDRTGAKGKLRSFYFRDPDQNLVEVANLVTAAPT